MSPIGRRHVFWTALILIVAVAATVLAVRFLGGSGGSGDAAPPSPAIRYHCPMHPAMQSDRPGDCPICQMRMIPIEGEEVPGAPSTQTTPSTQTAPSTGTTPATQPSGKKVIYRSTMNPSEVSDRPGKDSMGMEMVPMEVELGSARGSNVEGLSTVRLAPRKQQLIGVRTSVVKKAPFVRRIRTVGRIVPDETLLHHIHTKIEGWVEKLHVNATGEKVRKGDPLLSLYSPELLATQEEFLVALRAKAALGAGSLPEVAEGAAELLESSRRRLLLFDFTPEQIRKLEETGESSRTVTLYAPITGTVLTRNVTHGEKVNPEMTLFDVADLSQVWVLASVYEYELPFVKTGQAATMTLSYLPGRSYRGRINLVYPVLDSATRTVQVRLEFSNPNLDLRPEMYAHVELESDLGEHLAVPDTAVLSSGTRNIVFVAQGEGYFEPREVRLGLRLSDRVEILEGLSEGEAVVTSGNFLVDSESKLKAALEAVAAPPPKPAETPR